MRKPPEQRTHKRRVDASSRNLSTIQVMNQKNRRAHERNMDRKFERKKENDIRVAAYRKLTLEQKIGRLPFDGAKRQRLILNLLLEERKKQNAKQKQK